MIRQRRLTYSNVHQIQIHSNKIVPWIKVLATWISWIIKISNLLKMPPIVVVKDLDREIKIKMFKCMILIKHGSHPIWQNFKWKNLKKYLIPLIREEMDSLPSANYMNLLRHFYAKIEQLVNSKRLLKNFIQKETEKWIFNNSWNL